MKKLTFILLILLLALVTLSACENRENTGTDSPSPTLSSVGNNDNDDDDNDNNDDNNDVENNNAGTAQQNPRTPTETVLLYAELCTARDLQGLTGILYGFTDMTWNFNDDDAETFVEMIITIQNPNAQMEPDEIEYYRGVFPDLENTAIICAQEISRYRVHATNAPNDYVNYLDYYLVSTRGHPDWWIVDITPQAG